MKNIQDSLFIIAILVVLASLIPVLALDGKIKENKEILQRIEARLEGTK